EEQMKALAGEVNLLQRSGGPYGYRLRRIFLANFWLYTLQVFEIPHGRLLLTCNNASGKSTVLTAAIPMALDGSLRPERFVTFGGKQKHAEYYVLGNENSSTSFHWTKRTSYVALEFEWNLTEAEHPHIAEPDVLLPSQPEPQARYLTIGISLYGNETAN